MASYAKMIVLGNLVADPEAKKVKEKDLVTGRIAVHDPYKKESDFYDFEAWGGTAAYLSRFAVKGTMLLLEGTPKMEVWHDKEDNFHVHFKLVVRESAVLQRGRDHQEQEEPQSQRPAAKKSAPAHQRQESRPLPQEEDSDIPF